MVNHLLLFSNLSPSLHFTKSLQWQMVCKNLLLSTFIMKKMIPIATKYIFMCFLLLLLTEISQHHCPKYTIYLLEQVIVIVIMNKQHLSSKLALLYLTFKSRIASHSFAFAIFGRSKVKGKTTIQSTKHRAN